MPDDMDDKPATLQQSPRSRVWAEERGTGQMLLTWQRGGVPTHESDDATDARAVAATIGVIDGVDSAIANDGGVLVSYAPESVTRQQLAAAVRTALSFDADLKTRANEMMKRGPAYYNLAKSLALDERVSPVPEATRQAVATHGKPPPSSGVLPIAGRFIPGFPLITRLHALVPVLRTLTQWSREASPEVVDEHLERAGLSREQLDRDLATSQEAVWFARDYAFESASKALSAAAAAASQARDKTREWARRYAEGGEKPKQEAK